MAAVWLGALPLFPDPQLASPEGLLAIGGKLDTPWLLAAYQRGIFPWFGDGDPILWWSPDPRCVLRPTELHVQRRTERTLRQGAFVFSFDRDFEGVMRACAEVPRPGQEGTWITESMIEAYVGLHKDGYAHSLEVWQDDQLVGGLYGVSLGRVFFAESMFRRVDEASKLAVIVLTRTLSREGFELIDVQMDTPHLLRWGAQNIPRKDYLTQLSRALAGPDLSGDWTELVPTNR